MLGCPCKIIRPFTYATSKKGSYFQCSSVLKIPLGCSCYYTKSSGLYYKGRSKAFHKKELFLDIKKLPFKEQKNFILTSLLILKEKNSDVTSKLDNIPNKNTTDKTVNISENVNLQNEINKFENTAVNSSNSDIHIKKEKPFQLRNEAEDSIKSIPTLPSTHRVFGSPDSVESSEIIKKIDEKDETPSEQFEKLVIENLVLTEKKTKIAEHTTSTDGCCNKNENTTGSKKSEPNENVSLTDKLKLESKRDSEVRRQVLKLNLGEVNEKTDSLDPASSVLDDSDRKPDEVKPIKDAPQKFLEKAKSILKKTVGTKPEDGRSVVTVNLGEPKGSISMNPPPRRRQTVDLNRTSTERNFITPVRAMTDFLLKPSDLEGLRKTKRRSPYENDPPITVYWRKDVEAKALDIWGSKENLLKEILKRDIERRRYQQNLFTVKRRLRDYRREQGRESEFKLKQNGVLGSSKRVVLTAIVINGGNFLFKTIAWFYTGSHSMFSEAIHSLADTINQLILAYGIHKSIQRADSDHPYGYTNMRYVSSLISGVGIFCVGSGLSFYHGIVGLVHPTDLPSLFWGYIILLGSLASEGATLFLAYNSIKLGAKESEMSFFEYVFRGQDPTVNVVLLEDAAALLGVIFAGTCMGLSSYFSSHVPDAIGSLLVSTLLGGVASFIIYTNVAALVGRSIPQERLDKINAELESDVMIRAIHDVKGIDIGNSLVRYKAEMDFDGGELTRSYLDKQDLNQMLEEVKKMQTIDELEEFLLKHGENIVDMMGGEIDRIELKLRKKHPEIRHCDLEIL